MPWTRSVFWQEQEKTNSGSVLILEHCQGLARCGVHTLSIPAFHIVYRSRLYTYPIGYNKTTHWSKGAPS